MGVHKFGYCKHDMGITVVSAPKLKFLHNTEEEFEKNNKRREG
jgi:hypothetical protein